MLPSFCETPVRLATESATLSGLNQRFHPRSATLPGTTWRSLGGASKMVHDFSGQRELPWSRKLHRLVDSLLMTIQVAHHGTLFGNYSGVFSTCTVCIISHSLLQLLSLQPENTRNIPQLTKFRNAPKCSENVSTWFQVALLQLLQRLQPLPKLAAPPHLNTGRWAGEVKVDQGETISRYSAFKWIQAKNIQN